MVVSFCCLFMHAYMSPSLQTVFTGLSSVSGRLFPIGDALKKYQGVSSWSSYFVIPTDNASELDGRPCVLHFQDMYEVLGSVVIGK